MEGKITSLNLLAMLLIMQSRMMLAFLAARAPCWTHVQLALCQDPDSLFHRSAPQPASSQPEHQTGVLSQLLDFIIILITQEFCLLVK